MSKHSTLAHLQRVDAGIAAQSRRLAEITQLLAGDAALDAARASFDAVQRALDHSRAAMRDDELKAQALAAKIEELEQRLYSGKVTNPKELDGYARDAEMHKRLRGELDERMLVSMDTIDAAQKQANELARTAARLEAERANVIAECSRETQEILKRMDDLQAERAEARAQIDAQTLATYDPLLKSKAGQALAATKQGACNACGVTIPSGIAARVRQSEELVLCPSCGRILLP